MRRREFFTLLGAAAAWPLAARGQQSERVRRIGVLMDGDENDYDYKAHLSGFMQSMATSGWADSRNLLVDIR
jgi:putative tryptophan/tyrosine transport system substrate-binding protein